MPRPRTARSIERIIASEAKVRSTGKLNGVIGRAREIPPPEDYLHGVDWSTLCLPRNILCFLREAEVHDLRGWNGISTRSGKFDQHDRFVLLSVLDGSGTIGLDSEGVSLEEGEALLIFPNQLHYYLELAKEFSWLFQTFSLDEQQVSQFAGLRNSPRIVSRKARRLLNQSLDAYQGGTTDREALEASLLLGQLIGELVECESVDREAKDFGLVAQVRSYVFERAEEEIGLDAMAAHIGLTASNLKDEYRRATGDSLGGFVRSVRLVLAANLLRNSEASLETVAARCGFKSAENFAQAFEDIFRCSPAVYHAQHSGEGN